MLSVQKFLSRILKFLMICNLFAQFHLLFYSTCTPLYNQITTFRYFLTRTQTTILLSDSYIHLMNQYLLRYHHTRIALRQASRILLNLSLSPFAGFALLTVPRDAGLDQRDNIERHKAACCEQVKRRKSALFALTFVANRKAWTPSTAPVTPCASSPTAATVRSLSVAPRSVSLDFNIPTNHDLCTQIIINAVCVSFHFIVDIRRLF